MGTSGRCEPCLAGHEPKPLRHRPFLGKAHLTEALDLNGMQSLESQSGEKVDAG
jgi:hypothetical protein